MTDNAYSVGANAAAALPRRRRWLRAILVAIALAALAVVAFGAFLSTQVALDWIVGRAIVESGGRLAIEGATGSLWNTLRIARIAWRGDDVDIEAQDVALTWSPQGLRSREVNVSALHAQRILLTARTSANAATPLPTSLALPLDVNLRDVGVDRFEWRVGERAGVIDDLVFDYAGGASAHALRHLKLAMPAGNISGDASLGAIAPFTVQGALAFDGIGDLRDTQARIGGDGSLTAIALTATGSTRDATLEAKVHVAPLAEVPLVDAHIDARDVDVSRFGKGLPGTRLTITADAQPASGGFAGTLAVRNADAGTVDSGRVPLSSLTAAFALAGRELVLEAIRAELGGNGQVTGRAVVPVDGGASRWQIAVRDLDLRRLHGKLIATRLAGTLNADVAQGKQLVQGELGQTDLSLSFAATIAGSDVDIERFRGRAGAGTIAGRGHGSLDGSQAFEVTAQLTRLDPARFGTFPAGSLNGNATLRGVLAPRWRIDTEAIIAPGSHLEGLALAGHARGQATAGALRDVTAALTLASAKLKVDGNVGTPGDVLHYELDVDKLADLRSLVAHHAGLPVPEVLAGAVHAHGSYTSEPGGSGINLDLSANALRWGPNIALTTLAAKTTIGAGGLTLDTAAIAARSFAIDVAATGVHVPQGELATASASVTGTLAHHTATFAFKGDDIDTQVRATGGIPSRTGATAASAPPRWAGTLEQLTNHGTYALTLEAPTPIEWAAGLLHIGTARVAVADGHADLADFLWDNGRITTRGAFGGIPAMAIARLAGTKLPLATTLVIGGDWTLAANPRLNGTLRVFRERGDIFGTDVLSPNHADLALGVTALTVDARFVDDGVDATVALRSLRAGNADARLTVVAPANASAGHVARNAVVTASLTADLESLKPLQPWLSTTAVLDGSAHVELAARGTLDALKLTGTFRGDDVRVDLPQYGVNLTQGRLRAHVADERVVLDELARAAGDGTADAAPLGRLTWSATKFRVANRPDFRLVASGSGFVAAENGKLTLQGNVDIDQGRIDYTPSTAGTLGSDIVIVGRPQRTDARGTALDLPLALDIDVGLGPDLRFTGGGFDTGLTGRLRVTTSRSGTLVARGTIRAVNGTYFAFGQRLDIDRGQLIFDGPADNPALDVVALRRNLSVEAGVEVTGTVNVPRVRLVSNPPVPDGEKLSWLVTGQGLDRASRADLAALGAASASLLGTGQRPLTTTIANSLGLDDISLRSSSTATSTTGTSSQVVAFGKRISDRMTLVYEQGLTVATNALRIEYTLSRTLTLRAEAGVVSSLGLFFRRTYD